MLSRSVILSYLSIKKQVCLISSFCWKYFWLLNLSNVDSYLEQKMHWLIKHASCDLTWRNLCRIMLCYIRKSVRYVSYNSYPTKSLDYVHLFLTAAV